MDAEIVTFSIMKMISTSQFSNLASSS